MRHDPSVPISVLLQQHFLSDCSVSFHGFILVKLLTCLSLRFFVCGRERGLPSGSREAPPAARRRPRAPGPRHVVGPQGWTPAFVLIHVLPSFHNLRSIVICLHTVSRKSEYVVVFYQENILNSKRFLHFGLAFWKDGGAFLFKANPQLETLWCCLRSFHLQD